MSRVPLPLEDKLAILERLSERAIRDLVTALAFDTDRIVELARQRHIDGHIRHGDGLLYEYDDDRLRREIEEELADAVVYAARRLSLLERG